MFEKELNIKGASLNDSQGILCDTKINVGEVFSNSDRQVFLVFAFF